MSDDDLEIPDFLKRRKGEPAVPWQPLPGSFEARVQEQHEKWRELEQQRRDEKKAKSRGRVARMLAIKADRSAAAAGKTWDFNRSVWV